MAKAFRKSRTHERQNLINAIVWAIAIGTAYGMYRQVKSDLRGE